jgi:hypothetical protein
MTLKAKDHNSRRMSFSQCHFVTTNPIWNNLGLNPGQRGESPTTNDLSHGTALCRVPANSFMPINKIAVWKHTFVLHHRYYESYSSFGLARDNRCTQKLNSRPTFKVRAILCTVNRLLHVARCCCMAKDQQFIFFLLIFIHREKVSYDLYL